MDVLKCYALTNKNCYHLLEQFSLPPRKQQESDQSHLGNVNYILCGHFDKKIGGTPFRWGKVSRHRRRVTGGGCHLRKFEVAILKNICMLCSWNLQSMLESPFPFFISQKPGEIPIFRTFLAKFSIFSIFAYISLKIGYFELDDDYDVTVTSYLGRWYLLVCMERGDP